MRDNAARALRVEDDMPRLADLKAVTPDIPLPYEFPRERRFSRGADLAQESAVATLTAVPAEVEPTPEPVRPHRERKPAPEPRNAPGRAYGSHRRGEPAVGYQPGRRTVEIKGQAPAPRRRAHTQAAFVAHPDRTALWAFLLALFLVAMAIATAGPA